METVVMMLVLMAASGMYFAARYRSLVLQVRDLESRLALVAPASSTPAPTTHVVIPSEPLRGAGLALAAPPSDFRHVMHALDNKSEGRYRFPLGWYVGAYGPHLHTAQLVGDVNHILLSGQSDSGKDNAALGILLALAHQYTPERVQFAIVDGKGLDYIGWRNKAHTWLLATDPEEIAPAMQQLTAERIRRKTILADAGVSKWDNYAGNDLPLLVVFVSELLLLQSATSKSELTNWLEIELTAARAFGIRYLLATQTASNFSTQWRSQVSLFMAGFQPSQSQDAPNVAITTNEVDQAGAVPPSKLPPPARGAAGVFCIVQGADAVNVRTSYINDQQRDYILSEMPNKSLQSTPRTKANVPALTASNPDMSVLLNILQSGAPLPIAEEPVEPSYKASEIDKPQFVGHFDRCRTFENPRLTDSITTSYVELPLPDDVVPYDEQRRIIEAAPTVKSKRQLSLKLYHTDGGQKSTWVKLVCEATGLLQSNGMAQ